MFENYPLTRYGRYLEKENVHFLSVIGVVAVARQWKTADCEKAILKAIFRDVETEPFVSRKFFVSSSHCDFFLFFILGFRFFYIEYIRFILHDAI